jgi:hypothetical protein
MEPGRRKVLVIVLAAVWLGYSVGVLGWSASTGVPADLCIAR